MALLAHFYDRIRHRRQVYNRVTTAKHQDPLGHSRQNRSRHSWVKQNITIQTDLDQYPAHDQKRPRTSTILKYAALIPCGICRKSFDATQPQALFAHLTGHFDLRYSYNRCDECQINFVTPRDLRAHLKSVSLNKICGYMFNHMHPCSGHHPPRRRSGRGRYDHGRLATSKDNDRFDFCYRLRGWEHVQLASYRNSTPTMPSSPKSAHNTHWRLHRTGLLRTTLSNSSRRSHSSCDTPVSYSVAGSQLNSDENSAAKILGAALLRAICTGSVELVGAFVYAGADVGFRDLYGFGSMHYAARYGSPGIVRLLIRIGASIDDRDAKGESPLTHAIRAGMSDLAECFICLGAVLHESHVANAIETGDRLVVKMLLGYWKQPGKPEEILDRFLLAAVKQRDRRMVEILLESGARGSAEDDAGDTALSLAVAIGDKEIAQVLLDHGAQPDCSPGMQYNLIVDALKYRHLAMVELLLSKEVV